MKTVVLGGTLDGIELALRLKSEGKDVLLVSDSTYFGEEITETWKYYGEVSSRSIMPRIAKIIPDFTNPLLPGKVKKTLTRLLLDAGIQLRYMTKAIGLVCEDRKMTGVILADKIGINAIECDEVYDATLYHTASSVVYGKPTYIPKGEKAYIRMEYRGITPKADKAYDEELDIEIEKGELAADHAYVTVNTSFNKNTTITEARGILWKKAIKAAIGLKKSGLYCDLEMMNALPHSIICPAIDQKEPVQLETNQFVGKGILIGGKWFSGILPEKDGTIDFEAGMLADKITTDVLIAGGGTAGVRAAISAAESGKKVLLSEIFAHCGGTRTMGSIQPLFYGNRSKLFQKFWTEIFDFSESLSASHKYSRFGSGETLLYTEKIYDLAIDFHPCSIVCHVNTQGSRIESIICVDEAHVFEVDACHYLDATGDGDLARMSGVKMETGDPTSYGVQNYSHSNRLSGTRYDKAGADPDTMHPEYRSEWERALTNDLLDCADYDMVDMLTVRESSRIFGEYRVTIKDIARETIQPDALMDAYSSYDPHARTFGINGRLGLLPELAKARYASIPLRSLLCKEADNLIVIAKAISLDQEAFNYYRMSTDVMTLAHIVGKIIAAGGNVREVDLRPIQAEMISEGAIVRPPHSEAYNIRTADQIACELISGEEDAFVEMVLCDWPEVHDLLMAAWKNGSYQKRELMLRALLWYKEPSVIEECVEKLEDLVNVYGKEIYDDRAEDDLISGGVEGRINNYWRINQYAILFSRANEKQAIPSIRKAIEVAELGELFKPIRNTYGAVRVDGFTNSNYDRMLVLAEAASLMPDESYVSPLLRMLDLAKYGAEIEKNVYMDYLVLRIAAAAYCCGCTEMRELIYGFSRNKHLMTALHASDLL